MVRISKIVVTDENGNETTFEGEGFLTEPRSQNHKNQQYRQTVLAHITLSAKDINA